MSMVLMMVTHSTAIDVVILMTLITWMKTTTVVKTMPMLPLMMRSPVQWQLMLLSSLWRCVDDDDDIKFLA